MQAEKALCKKKQFSQSFCWSHTQSKEAEEMMRSKFKPLSFKPNLIAVHEIWFKLLFYLFKSDTEYDNNATSIQMGFRRKSND